MRAGTQAAAVVVATLLASCASSTTPAPIVIRPVASAPAGSGPGLPASVAETPIPDPAPVLPAPVVEGASAEEAAPIAEAAAIAAPRRDDFRRYLSTLSETSCPAGARREAPDAVELGAKAVSLQSLNPSRKQAGELTFVAGYQLTSPDKRFGGLSGADLLDNGNLLAVSDQGDFVWIDLAEDGLRPVAARIASMRDAVGNPLRGKADGDSEGLAVNGGMALVSYERNHRVLAFDVGRCGSAARGAPIVFGGYGEPLSEAFGDARIRADANQGPEALAVTRDWQLFTGVETKIGDQSPLSARPIEARPDFDLRIGKGAPEFVGLDLVEADSKTVRAFSLHRSFSPLAGNAIVIFETEFRRVQDPAGIPRRVVSEIDERSHDRFEAGPARKLAELGILLNVDNFEGIAAKPLADGRVRLYLISDDNFSVTQRTLLFVFDAPKN
jgi:hypothetical protein